MSRIIDPSPPAGPRTPQPPRNPAPIPQRPVPPPPPPRPSRFVFNAAVLAFTALSIAGGVSLIVGWFARSVDTWNAPSDYTADLLLLPLVSLHVLVSLALKPQRRRTPGRFSSRESSAVATPGADPAATGSSRAGRAYLPVAVLAEGGRGGR